MIKLVVRLAILYPDRNVSPGSSSRGIVPAKGLYM